MIDMKFSVLMAICLFISINIFGQIQLAGRVVDENNINVPFANILIHELELGGSADDNGNFLIEVDTIGEFSIKVSAIGYGVLKQQINIHKSSTIVFTLQSTSMELDQVVITGTMKEIYLKDSPVKVEVISSAFLKTNPTNNVIEAIQTVNGVQEQINCGVCGTNDIHINGLEGPYTLVLIDGMPIMSALASVYGFNGIPTALVDRIEIIKGPSSTLYGTEAVGGVINVITKRPEDLPKIGLNTFYTSHHELNTDLSFTQKIGDNVATTLSANYYRNQYRMDFNNDNFTDIPLNNRISIFNRWSFVRPGNKKADAAIRYYNEDRFGGVMGWQKTHKGSDVVYGETISTERVEVIGDYQLSGIFEDLRINYSYNNHNQNSYYGNTHYKAQQSIYFTNLIWNKTITNHDVIGGITLRYDNYEDNTLADSDYSQFIPGIFVQDEWKLSSNSTLLFGVRFDYHEAHGLIISPRLNLKQNITNYTTARLNMGTGFRRVNLFTEDHAALTGARTVHIENDLKPEKSLNVNLNLNHVFAWRQSSGTIDVDGFYTYFNNKIIPDYEFDPNLIVYDNLSGYGITRGIAFSYQQQFTFPLQFGLGGTFQDVYEVTEDDMGNRIKESQVFAPKFSGTFNISYHIRRIDLSIDYTGKIMGPQYLPRYETPYERPEQSLWYTIQNIQLTKKIKHGLEIYTGVKNLGNWTQDSPLINPENPFSDTFDTTYAWGPLQPRRYYLGLRYNLY